MAVTTLDTHEVVKELIAAGFTDVQAEAVTRQLRLAQNIDLSNLMTKSDGASLERGQKSLENSVKSLESGQMSLKNSVKSLESGQMSLENSIKLLETSLRAEISKSRSDSEKSLAETKTELVKWLVGTVGLQTVVILGTVVTLIKFMGH